MKTVKAVRELRQNIAHAQALLRETRDERAIAEADRLEERSEALGALLDELTRPQWSPSGPISFTLGTGITDTDDPLNEKDSR